ncbi:hypothetical protein [Pseudomonas purpurea]|uniref:hypothetical protein n=1 Tax=Pseudomonas purpurea TaxID=3136737 RepID=UPI0032674B91
MNDASMQLGEGILSTDSVEKSTQLGVLRVECVKTSFGHAAMSNLRSERAAQSVDFNLRHILF